MADKKKKIILDDGPLPIKNSDLNQEDDIHDPLQIRKVAESRKVRKVAPLGMRVLVRVRKDGNVSEGGLYLPEGAKQNTEESLLAEVIEVASAAGDYDYEDETNISGIPLGAVVLISKHSGVKVPWDDSLRIVETKEVLAIVHEMSLS